jgi:hypothetical protein
VVEERPFQVPFPGLQVQVQVQEVEDLGVFSGPVSLGEIVGQSVDHLGAPALLFLVGQDVTPNVPIEAGSAPGWRPGWRVSGSPGCGA